LPEGAKNDGMASVVMSQLNRGVEQRSDKRPQLADLRESGAIEERAKFVVFLYRGFYYGPDPIRGIDYDNGNPAGTSDGQRVDVFAWHLCATLEFQYPTPAWPSPGAGTIITWDAVNTCQQGLYATAGYFYLAAYHADRFAIIPRPVDQTAALADCESREMTLKPDRLGSARFSPGGNESGCNPLLVQCEEPVPVTPTTWSRVKTLVAGGP